MAEVNIRRMTIEDVDSVHAIECATFPKPWQREDFVKEMTQNTCARYLVAETDGNVIGFAGTWIVLDEAHITNVAVLEAYRGQGIGKKLTGALMQWVPMSDSNSMSRLKNATAFCSPAKLPSTQTSFCKKA